jgi:hypothetical protein
MYQREDILLIQVFTCLISQTTAKSTLEQTKKAQEGIMDITVLFL